MAEELANLKLEVIDRSADLLVAANGDVVSAVRSPGGQRRTRRDPRASGITKVSLLGGQRESPRVEDRISVRGLEAHGRGAVSRICCLHAALAISKLYLHIGVRGRRE